jgi:LmbE family N-acetylglucosaminyl deacetylase
VLRAHGGTIARALLTLLALAAALASAPAAAGGPAPARTPCAPDRATGVQLPALDATTSVLIVAPHPDDETLCCGGLIQRVVGAGGRASVVWITSGDASRLDLLLIDKSVLVRPAKLLELGVRRMREARAATALLGVPPEGQLFLGYPDRGVQPLLSDHYATVYTSGFTAAAAVPYSDALFPGHAYTGESLGRDFEAVLERVRPTLVLAPSPRDSHPDHSAAGQLTLRVMRRRGQLPAVRWWIVHGGEGWPGPRDLSPGLPLPPAPRLQGAPLAAFELTPREEDAKLAAVRAYPTQMQALAPFLLAFVRTSESFSAAP